MRNLTAVHVKLESGEGWHYANVGRDGGYPIGNCRNHSPHAPGHPRQSLFLFGERRPRVAAIKDKEPFLEPLPLGRCPEVAR